ncbi:hypothetical protein D3C73_975670 [compost metagenome]
MRGYKLAGQQQAPGGGVDEQRRAVAQVRLPVAGADLVADQGVTGAFVRDTQQRFGQAHQRHAFLGRQGEFLQQALNDAGTAASALLIAQFFSNRGGEFVGGFGHRCRQASLLDQHRHDFRLRATVGGGDRRAQYRLRQDAFGEFEEALVGVIQRRVDGVVEILGRTVQLGQGCTTLEFFQVIEDCLLDQPVRRAINRGRGGLEAFAGRVVKFDAKGGGSHVFILMFATTAWHQLAARLAVRLLRCNRVQPFFCRNITQLVRK